MFARSLVLLASYSVLLTLSLYVAYLLRFDFAIPPDFTAAFDRYLPFIVGLELAWLFLLGQFSMLLSYFRIPDLYRIVLAIGVSSLLITLAWYAAFWLDIRLALPRSVIIINTINGIVMLVAFRLLLRIARERLNDDTRGKSVQRVAIAGAGDVGAQVAAELLSRTSLGMRPVVFLDDDRAKWRKRVHGIPVVDSADSIGFVKDNYGVESLIIAMPSASVKRIREIVSAASENNVRTEIVPSLADFATGQVKATRVRQVQIEDLLGRDPVKLDADNIRDMIQGRVVAVTGAGGSIGSELARQVAGYNPKRLLLLEQSEFALYGLENSMQEAGFTGITLPLVCNICDIERVRHIFTRYRPEIVFHAAAHKHVPIMERQPDAALRNNSLGTARLADLASECGVDRFVLISTDKAINPTSAMGASKRLAEIYIQAKNFCEGNNTKFMAVRFGNVLNSSGSVIPLFRSRSPMAGRHGQHPEVTRYFMTIPEAVGLVLQCRYAGQRRRDLCPGHGYSHQDRRHGPPDDSSSPATSPTSISTSVSSAWSGRRSFTKSCSTATSSTSRQSTPHFRFAAEPRQFREVLGP
jgi:FlaA1/EpsC-like NDP-sugar epimerase